jgi:hypothetical protein
MSIALAHPHKIGDGYIAEHFPDAPVVEITTTDRVSQKFRDLSSWKKIGIKIHNAYMHKECPRKFARHLQVNWSDLILNNTAKEYERILTFVDATGNVDAFVSAVQDYCDRNQELIAQANES